MSDATETKLAPTYRIDIVEEASGTVMQSVRGISERRIVALVRALNGVGGLIRDFKAAREAIDRAMGNRG